MALVYIGLGSNLGDRALNMKKACAELLLNKDITLLKKSAVEETAPVDYLDQPHFLNQIILINTELPPHKLLEILNSIEKKFGREKSIPKGPRIIDMDILLFDDYISNDPLLTIPHPEIKNRPFVLKQLIEIDPGLVDPVSGEKYAEILK